MKPYGVLLVDDEEDIRLGISRKMDWNELGFSLVGEAENGLEALDLAEQLRPDIVLTDIKMPFMDGLELCRVLSQKMPATKVIIFSGFDDFHYAQQAIHMNVLDYILKPINSLELAEVLRKTKTQLDEERSAQRNIDVLRERYEESLPVLREIFYTRLLDGRLSEEILMEKAAQYEIHIERQAWVVALVSLDDITDRDELTPLSVQKLFAEHIQNKECKTVLYNDAVALLFGFSTWPDVYELVEDIERVCKLASAYLGIKVTVGVGEPSSSLKDVHLSAQGAQTALNYRVLTGTGRVIYIDDMEPTGQAELVFEESDESELVSAVKFGEEKEIQLALDKLAKKFSNAGLSLSQGYLFFLELLTCIIKMARAADMELDTVFGKGFVGIAQITDFDSAEKLWAWCFAKCVAIQNFIEKQRSDSTWRTVEKAKAFIAENYANSDLSVDMLCEHLHLSPAYFSTLFKREVGASFTSYVTETRMTHAADMLRTTDEKTYLIAEKTGYIDPNYFSYVFKRHFGVSPTKYRAS